MLTLQQIDARVLNFLSETSDNNNVDQPARRSFINDAVRMTAAISESTEDSIEVTPDVGIGAYTLPSDNLLITHAYFGNKYLKNDLKPLKIYTKEVIKSISPYWLDETDESRGTPARLILVDRMTVFLDPRPDSENITNKKLVLWYIFEPQGLGGDGDVPNIAPIFHPILAFYATYLCYLKLKNPEMATKFYNDFLVHYNLIKGIATRGSDEAMRLNFTFREE